MNTYKKELQKYFRFCPHCANEFSLQKHESAQELMCSNCGYIMWLNSKPTASALIINDENEVLLGTRAIDPLKGWWDIPGGFLELYEKPEEGIVREIKEELGITLQKIQMLPCMYVGTCETTPIQITFNTYAIARVPKNTRITPQDDVASTEWISILEIPKKVAFESNRAALAYLQEHYKELRQLV